MRRFLLYALMLGGTHGLYAAELGLVGAPICGYGMYHYGTECVSFDIQSENCPAIDGRGSYHVKLDSTTFLFQENSDLICRGTHSLYAYDEGMIAAMVSTGTLRTFGPPMCGYGQYRINGECHAKTDDVAVGLCPTDYHKTGSDSATFMSLFAQGNVCLGLYGLYEYSERLYPLYNGILLTVGAPLETAADMRGTRCSINPDNYYQIAVADPDTFTHPDMAVCPSDSGKFVVKSDCKDITESDLAANPVCGVLCDSGVYTNTGLCATGYCESDGKRRRMHFVKDGTEFSIPLYASSTTTPALNVANVADDVCYVNMVTAEQANTIRIKYNDIVYYGID